MKGLHGRLLVSYALVLMVAMVFVGMALFGFAALSSVRLLQPLQRLSSISLATRTEVVRLARTGATVAELGQMLQETAVTQNVRILLADATTRLVIYDSDPQQDWLGIEVRRISNPPRWYTSPQPNIVAGLFRHPNTGVAWVVYGQPLSVNHRLIVFYVQRPPTAWGFFREYFLRPLFWAGLAAFALSILLALAIANSVVRPLQKLAAAATAVSQGNYQQPVTPEGPTEVQQVAESFNSMAAQVQVSQQAQRDFVANVSHDLKTPITSITGWSQALLDGTAVSAAEQQRAATIIHNEAQRMARMVSQLLDLARIESGQLELAQTAVDLHYLLTNVHHNLALRAQEQQIHLTSDLQAVPPIWGDQDRLMQVFTNLVDNALTHTPANGRIHLTLKRYGDKAVEATIQDTGEGIPAQDLSRIFERFYRVDKSRAQGNGRRGSGLGLAIARQLVEAHHGRIQAHSQPGQGSLFVVRLPISDQPEAPTVIKRGEGAKG